jgi:hypothetical protein
LEEEINFVLDNAMARFQKDRGLRRLRNSKELLSSDYTKACCWPISKGYIALAKEVKIWTPQNGDRHAYIRERLIADQKFRSYFQFD